MDDRLAKLEEKIAFLEQALNELSEEHYSQQKELDNITRRLEILSERYKNQIDSGISSSETSLSSEEKPPHY